MNGAGAIAAAPPPSIGGTLFSFVLVLGLIFALAWILKRVKGRVAVGGEDLRVRASLSLGMKDRLVLVDAAGEHLLLGVSASGIQCLHRYEGALPEPKSEPNGFATLLQRFQPAKDRSDAH